MCYPPQSCFGIGWDQLSHKILVCCKQASTGRATISPPHPRGYRWTSPPCSRTQGSVSIVLFCGVTHVLPIPKSSCCGGQTGGLLSLLHDSCLWHSRLDKPQGLKQFMSRYQLERRFHSCRGLPLKNKLDLGVREVHKPVQLVSAINTEIT